MGKAIIEIETYNNEVGTTIKYEPHNICPYKVIGVLQRIIRSIETNSMVNEKDMRR